VIEFRDVVKDYGAFGRAEVRAVDGFSIAVPAGEVIGLAGPNGAGKSTLIALLLGYLTPTHGTVRVAGIPPREYAERHGVGYLSELVSLNSRWRADEVLRRFAVLAGVPSNAMRARVDDAVARLGLEEHRHKRLKTLSKGTLQRLGIAQALLRDERVLVLDEPTHGLDPVWTQRFRDLVASLRRPDRAILIASHNLDELERVTDRVAIIDRGRLQRVVETARGAPPPAGAATYRLTFAAGAEHAAIVFPGALALGGGRGEFEIVAADLAVLNRGLAELLARGAVLAAVVPARTPLERAFRDAIGEGRDQ
jgi:ABC-type multidrug transport system ATPase subunit